MPVKTFITNEEWTAGIEARSDVGYRTLSYSGTLDGGTLQISTQVAEGDQIAIADGKLDATMLDGMSQKCRKLDLASDLIAPFDGGVP